MVVVKLIKPIALACVLFIASCASREALVERDAAATRFAAAQRLEVSALAATSAAKTPQEQERAGLELQAARAEAAAAKRALLDAYARVRNERTISGARTAESVLRGIGPGVAGLVPFGGAGVEALAGLAALVRARAEDRETKRKSGGQEVANA